MSGEDELSQEVLPIPESFKCPISHEVMTDPVSTCDGHTYDRASIQQWFQRSGRSPLTNNTLPTRQLTPNHALRSAIEAWRSLRPEVIVNQDVDLEFAVKCYEEELSQKMRNTAQNVERLERENRELWNVINQADLASMVNRSAFELPTDVPASSSSAASAAPAPVQQPAVREEISSITEQQPEETSPTFLDEINESVAQPDEDAISTLIRENQHNDRAMRGVAVLTPTQRSRDIDQEVLSSVRGSQQLEQLQMARDLLAGVNAGRPGRLAPALDMLESRIRNLQNEDQ